MKSALHFPRIGKTLLAAALVAMAGTGCATDQSLLGKLGGIFGASAATKSAGAGKPIEGDIDAAKALVYLYGGVQHNGRNKTKTSVWDCAEWAPRPFPDMKDEFGEAVFGAGFNGKKAEACKILGEKYSEQGKEKYMLMTLSKFFAGSGEELFENLIGASIFVNEGGQWKLESHDDFWEMFMAWRGMDAGNVGKGGADKKPGMLFYHYEIERCTVHRLTAFMPYGKGVKKFGIGDKQVSEFGDVDYVLSTRPVTCDEAFLRGHASFDASSTSDYPDIVVKYGQVIDEVTTGDTRSAFGADGRPLTHEEEITVKPVGGSRWRFQNGEYKEVKTGKKGGKKTSTKKRK